MTTPDHERRAQEIVAKFAKGKEHFASVRDLMGHLAHAEIIGAAQGRPPQTGFIKGENPEDWDLEALYQAAIHAHPQTRKKVMAAAISAAAAKQQAQQQPAGRESVRDSINRAVTGKPVDKPKAEPVRDSIRRAMKG
jgi:hypothetical protein